MNQYSERCTKRTQASGIKYLQIGKTSAMNKKQINSPKLSANFLFWVCDIGGVFILLGYYVGRVF